MIPLKDYIDNCFGGSIGSFAAACGVSHSLISNRVDNGNYFVQDGMQYRVYGDAPANPVKPTKGPYRKPRTLAGKFEKRMNRVGNNRGDIEEEIIDSSIDAGRYGSDDIYYNMPDGSVIIKRVIVDEWMEKK